MESIYITPEELLETKRKTAKPLLWVGIASIVIFFAGLTSAYVIRQAQGDWLFFDIPSIFYYSTATILVSSLTMALAQWMAKKGQMKAAAGLLIITAGLGVAFSWMQWEGWFVDLFNQGVTFTGQGHNISGSFFFIMVFAHLAHLISGLIAVLFTMIKALLGKYSIDNHIGIEVCATYWHFLDILWIYLILFLVFIR